MDRNKNNIKKKLHYTLIFVLLPLSKGKHERKMIDKR